MTVEQSTLSHYNQGHQENDDYKTITEITGIQDHRQIKLAMEACTNNKGSYDLNEVIQRLVQSGSHPAKTTTTPDKNAKAVVPSDVMVPTMVTHMAQGVGTEGAVVSTQNKQGPGSQGVIDLTNEAGEDDLQKAIVASLQDTPGILGGQISREEQEISKVLEASLAESKAGTKRKRGDLWFVDPLNPHERKRKDVWPVGLKNVGNTCWFSAVIQSLFHLPVFRRLVLNFSPPSNSLQKNSVERNLQFMQELRSLFALMLGTKRKYVDPSKAVEILKEAFTNGTGTVDSQQDVSEFQHKLLEWLEDAFRSDLSRPPSPAHGASGSCEETQPNNPMVQLFYGQYMAEGINEDKEFLKKETFGQFPLQVNGFRDIHESLEAATAQGEIETVSMDVTKKSGQELWFTRLPPVLTFELSRFQFNQHFGRPEKIHNKLDFPQLIHMDRYLECNKAVTRQKREELKRVREQLQQLQSRMDKFIHYGSGSKRFPLGDILQYALEFAGARQSSTQPTSSPSTSEDVEMDSPKSQSSCMQTDSPACTPPRLGTVPPDVTMTAPNRTPPKTPPKPLVIPDPTPRHVAPGELRVLQTCLTRWRTEVESDVKELQDGISCLEECVRDMYKDSALQKNAYRLHAVLVHEGQAASGHYWAYVYSNQHKKWLKFNDITVTETTWEELQKESVGGYHNASAYCLMYVDANRGDLIEGSIDAETGQDTDSLPTDLQKLVGEDNARFEKEIKDWDNEQKKRALMATNIDNDVLFVSDSRQAQGSSPVGSKIGLPAQHAQLLYKLTCEIVSKIMDSETNKKQGPTAALREACVAEKKRLEGLANGLRSSLPRQDARLGHIMVYLIANNAPLKEVQNRALLEQFGFMEHLDNDEGAKKIREVAVNELTRLKANIRECDEKDYQKWHVRYSHFRKTVLQFLTGVEHFHKENYPSALLYLSKACEFNTSLTEGGKVFMGTDIKLLLYYRRQCLLHVNETALNQIETEENVEGALDLCNKYILPSLTILTSSLNKEDQYTVEDIREKWCSILGKELSPHKIEKLQDFLSKLFEPPTEVKSPASKEMFDLRDMPDLIDHYHNVIALSEKHGYLEKAIMSK